MPANHLRAKIKALEQFSFHDELIAIVTANQSVLADLQAEQLAQGINSQGQVINPPYSPFTIEQKQKHGVGLGKITSRVVFFDTGELYKLLRAQINGDKFSIVADSFKFTKMIQRSGVNTVGLDKESRERFALNIVRPRILEAYKKKVTDI